MRLVQRCSFWVVGALAVMSCACDSAQKPQIVSFTTSTQRVAPGKTALLSWEVQHADRVVIEADPGDRILLDGNVPKEQLQTPPIERALRFTLTAEGIGGVATATLVIAPVEPQALAVLRFGAHPPVLAQGELLTLQWETQGASFASIETLGGEVIVSEVALPDGQLELRPAQSATYVLRVQDERAHISSTVDVTVLRPEVRTFAVEPETIVSGAQAEIVWAVAFAEQIEIQDSSGRALYDGTSLSGRLMITPTESTTYSLIARDGAGNEALASAPVFVSGPALPLVVRFEASPSTVNIGEESALFWEVLEASEIELWASGERLLSSARLEGALTVTPTVTTEYQLFARSLLGETSSALSVVVQPSVPAVLEFVASPDPGPIGGSTTLRWRTLGAERLEIEQDGALIYQTALEVDEGALEIELLEFVTQLRLIAFNTYGETSSLLDVSASLAPVIEQFEINPRTFIGSATVTISWSTAEATSVVLRRDGALDPLFPMTPGGVHPVYLFRSTLFELVASSEVGTVSRALFVSTEGGETEPNDTPERAQVLGGAGGRILGTLSVADEDWFELTVPLGGSVSAQTSDGGAGCNVDTALELYAVDGVTLLGADDNSGNGACSSIDPVQAPFAADLASGRYYLRVHHQGVPGSYTLDVTIASSACGNSIRESRAQEQCDDGNAISGDGCDASCMVEFTSMLLADALDVDVEIQRSITPVGDQDYFQIDMPSAGFITAQTFAPTPPTCSDDTVITLLDAQLNELVRAEQGGVGDCSLLHYQRQPSALVAPGTYFLRIEEQGNDAPIVQYTLRVSTRGPGCGNGILEPLEECDDGNQISMDGCNSACAFEGLLEVEPNDTPPFAQALPGNSARVLGHISQGAERDVYALTVLSNASVRAWVHDGGRTCRTSTGTIDSVLTLYDPGVIELGQNDNGSVPPCSTIDPFSPEGAFARSLTAGTYFLEVRHANPTGLGRYVLEVRLELPTCGNGLLEPGEQCDDGALLAGDGCDPSCAFEILASVSTSTTGLVVPLSSPGAFGTVAVDVLDGQSIEALTYTAPGVCDTDTLVGLLDASFTGLGVKQEGGPLSCGAIIYPSDTFATSLPAGRYYVRVGHQGGPTGDVRLDLILWD